MPDMPRPITFRADVIAPVIALVKRGESCALVGVRSAGKSNIARHLKREDVRLHYFGADAPCVVVLRLNCRPYALRPLHELYLDALDQLNEVIKKMHFFGPVQRTLDELRVEAVGKSELLAKRNLDKAFGVIIDAGAMHIVILLDDCDDLFAKAPPFLFGDLRELRDNHKLQVVYVAFTRQDPLLLRAETPEYEDFYELVSPRGHIIPIQRYSETDAMDMVRRLANRAPSSRAISDQEVRLLCRLAGCHAGLIRSLFFAGQGADLLKLDPPALVRLVDEVDVSDECRRIMESLQDDERADLLRLVCQEVPSAKGLRLLETHGLVDTLYGRPVLFSPVFERYVCQYVGITFPTLLAIQFSGVGRQVRVNNALVDTLSPAEYELLRLLYAKRRQSCSRAELVEAVLRGERNRSELGTRGDPLSRVDQYIRRLQAKIGAAGQCIIPEGDGYQLAV